MAQPQSKKPKKAFDSNRKMFVRNETEVWFYSPDLEKDVLLVCETYWKDRGF